MVRHLLSPELPIFSFALQECPMSEELPHSASATAILTAAGTLVSWDAEAARLTGYTWQEVQGNGFLQLFRPMEVMHHLLIQTAQGKPTPPKDLELQCRDNTGKMVSVQSSLQVSCLDLGKPQIVVMFRELAPGLEQLRQTHHLAVLGKLAGVLSHEIRNPLSTIMLHVDMLRELLQELLPGPNFQVSDSLRELQTELFRIRDLVEDYLSLARLINLQREPGDLQSLLAELLSVLQDALNSQDIVVHLQGVATEWLVPYHCNSLRRALLNLLQNAIDAMPHGGTLKIHGWKEKGWFYLVIEDSGMGIPEEVLSQLFLPFHTTKSEGTGLGLYIVQEIIRAHAGAIDVASIPGEGTTFTLKLPLTIAPEVE